jgi:hypothetical protein
MIIKLSFPPNHPAATNPATASRCHAEGYLRRLVDRNRSATPLCIEGVFNPEGWQIVVTWVLAGERKSATPSYEKHPHPRFN